MKVFLQIPVVFLLAGAFLLTCTASNLAAATGFKKDLVLHGITFYIGCANDKPVNKVHIRLSGSGVDPAPVTHTINGTVTWAEVTDDLDNDGSPELYIYATCPAGFPLDSDIDDFTVRPYMIISAPYGGHELQADRSMYFVTGEDGREGPSAIIGPGVVNRVDDATVGLFPLFTVKDPDPRACIRELKYVLVNGKKGRALQLAHSQ
jgi:hypothetical protein